MKLPFAHRAKGVFHLRNSHVIMILLVAGAALLGVTWIVAGEFGRVPLSLWDICSSVLPAADGKAAEVVSAKP